MLEPGIYITTQDITLSKPDRRYKRQWPEAPIKMGTKFNVIEHQPIWEHGEPYLEIKIIGPAYGSLKDTHPDSLDGIRFKELAAVLAPVDNTPLDIIRTHQGYGIPAFEALRIASEHGILTVDDAHKICTLYDIEPD